MACIVGGESQNTGVHFKALKWDLACVRDRKGCAAKGVHDLPPWSVAETTENQVCRYTVGCVKCRVEC